MPYIIILSILIILASGRYNQLCFLSEEVINRIIALTKEEGDAIDDKVGMYLLLWVKNKLGETLFGVWSFGNIDMTDTLNASLFGSS